ncbi:sorting nexin-11-like isoform X1 [Cetorhinus maximus]
MMKDQEEEEFITVRVQDPRIQDQSSWSPYVDYKIFLYTNSKAFTVKTSCVRRRYREFVWLRRRLQKNSGLVPLPELPGKKPFFQVNDSEGIERRRQGLQQFLEKVLHTMIFLSDSQLHLFLQTQLPTAQIECCVQGQTPFSVNEAILDNAMCRKSVLHREGAEAIGYECESSPSHILASDIETSAEIPATLDEPAASDRI